jgi:hypothetical protein
VALLEDPHQRAKGRRQRQQVHRDCLEWQHDRAKRQEQQDEGDQPDEGGHPRQGALEAPEEVD